MFTAARRCVSNALSGVSLCGCNRYNPNIVTGCCIKKLTRTANSSSGGLKAAVTIVLLLFIMGTIYCLYGTGGSIGGTVTPAAFSQQSLGNSDLMSGVQPDVNANVVTMTGGNGHTSIDCIGINGTEGRREELKTKPPSNVVTAADMYEPGFRIRNAGLCSTSTRLLVLITSAAAPAHSQNRQAIRMTWMNRYGPSVSMAFLVGTPQMSETDPVAQVLEAEEQALKIRLNQLDINSNIKPKEKIKFNASATNVVVEPVDGDPERYRLSQDQEPNPGEGLDAHAMHGLNEAERAVQRVLGREYGRYGDLVQCQSRDTYTNLTLKSIAALEWTRQYCPWARYLLKTDDDMFIDIRRLLRFINKVETETTTEPNGLHPRPIEPINDPKKLFTKGADMFDSVATSSFDIELPPTIWGRLAHGWPPIRQPSNKYYVSRAQYNGEVFPDFCTGPAYLMTRSAVSPLYEAALGKDFDVVDDEDEDGNQENQKNINEEDLKVKTYIGEDCGNDNQTLGTGDDKATSSLHVSKNTVPYLKLEDVYLTGVVAERLTRRATERQARRELKEKQKISSSAGDHNQKSSYGKVVEDNDHPDGGKNTKPKTTDIIVKVRRIHDDQFANTKITGRALDQAVCNGLSPNDTDDTNESSGFSWFRWYWGDTALDKDLKEKKTDKGVISLHMVKYYEQFDLWRRLMDDRIKCTS